MGKPDRVIFNAGSEDRMIQDSAVIEHLEDHDVAKQSNHWIELAKRGCHRRDEEKRGKSHVFMNHARKCECGDIDLDKYSNLIK